MGRGDLHALRDLEDLGTELRAQRGRDPNVDRATLIVELHVNDMAGASRYCSAAVTGAVPRCTSIAAATVAASSGWLNEMKMLSLEAW
jgi:hypothetical protein